MKDLITNVALLTSIAGIASVYLSEKSLRAKSEANRNLAEAEYLKEKTRSLRIDNDIKEKEAQTPSKD